MMDAAVVESGNFAILIGAIASTLGIGILVMRWAYQGQGSVVVIFPNPVDFANRDDRISQNAEQDQMTIQKAIACFQTGSTYFKSQNYGAAVEQFRQAVDHDPTFAEAYHNGGLALANLRKDNEAVRSLLKAGDLYAEANDPEAIARLKQQMDLLRQRPKP